MANVYEVIDALREGKRLSMRRLALNAAMSPAAFFSVMDRKPKDVSVKFLKSVAKALGVEWQEFYGCEPEEYEKYGVTRVSSFVTEEHKDKFLYEKLGSAYQSMKEQEDIETYHAIESVLNDPGISTDMTPQEKVLYNGILVLLNGLNVEGLKDVLGHVLEISKDENYCKKE